MAISKLNFYFCNITFPLKKLLDMENSIVDCIRNWLKLNKSSNRDIMFIPKSKGGLGILHPTTMYIAKKMSFLLQCLNSDDPQTRHSARSSFELHMTKRKAINQSCDEDVLFGQFRVDANGRVIKESKVNWPKSIWVELNELCIHESLKLEYYNDVYAMVSTEDDDINLIFKSHTALCNHLKQSNIDKRVHRLGTLESQGRVFQSKNIDHQLSSNYLSNLAISDSLVQFTLKSRMQLLECNSLLHKYYPNTHAKSCKLCNNPSDTISHIMNGCLEYKNMYSARHDRLVNHISDEIKKLHPHAEVVCNKIITGDLLGSSTDFNCVLHRKPDIFIYDRQTMKTFIVEISVPFDAFVDKCYNTKFNYYQPLNGLISLGTNYSCKTLVIIIGSLGCIHTRVTSGLKLLGFSTRKSKAIARYLSISAMIGSNIVWKSRTRKMLSL